MAFLVAMLGINSSRTGTVRSANTVFALLQLTLRAGVRGTLRDATKNAWIRGHFDEKYGAGKLELAEVKDLSTEGALDEAVKGKSATEAISSTLLT